MCVKIKKAGISPCFCFMKEMIELKINEGFESQKQKEKRTRLPVFFPLALLALKNIIERRKQIDHDEVIDGYHGFIFWKRSINSKYQIKLTMRRCEALKKYNRVIL